MIARLATFLSPAPLLLAGATRRHFLSGDLDLVYYEFPSAAGITWVLLHGLATTAASCLPLAQALRGKARLLVPELTAMGGSRCPGGGLNVSEGVQATASLIAALHGGPVAVAGMSLGGWIGIRLACAHPELVSRLLLLDAAGYRHQDWDHVRSLVRVESRADARRLSRALFARRTWLRPLVGRPLRSIYSSPPVQRIVTTISEQDTYGDSELRRIGVPADLVWGERDLLFPPSVGRAMARALPRGRLELIRGCGHAAQWDRPRALKKTVRSLQDR